MREYGGRTIKLAAGIYKNGVIMAISILSRIKTVIRLSKNHAADEKRWSSIFKLYYAASVVCMNATKSYEILPDALTFAPLYISIRYMLRLRLMLCISGEL